VSQLEQRMAELRDELTALQHETVLRPSQRAVSSSIRSGTCSWSPSASAAPDIQEEIFFLPAATEGRPSVTERDLRQVLKTVVWSEQRERWAALRQMGE
jgi:hypothetical protein